MYVEVGVILLISVCSFSLYETHVMVLDSEVQAGWGANIVNAEAICFACLEHWVYTSYDKEFGSSGADKYQEGAYVNNLDTDILV